MLPDPHIELILEQNQFHLADVPVFAKGLQNQGIHGLIGRDVLRHMLLVYNGYAAHCTLAVSSPGDTSTTCAPLLEHHVALAPNP